MATFKVKLDTRRKLNDDTYPLVIRIHSGRTRRDINLKTYLKETEFDSETGQVNSKHPNRKEINQLVKKRLIQLQQTTLKLEIQDEVVSAGRIKTRLIKPTPKLNFIQYAEKVIAEMREVNRNGNANAYRDALSALKEYSGRAELQFKELDYELLLEAPVKLTT